jgi:hypothetical protein
MLVQIDGSALVKGDIDNNYKLIISGFTELLPAGGNSKTLWGGTTDHYQLDTARQINIKSDNANDITNGTGARTIKINGIDSSKVAVEETITLNGVTPVQTTNSYFVIYNFIVTSVGSQNNNQGNIIAYYTNVSTEIVNYIKQNENNSSMCIYRVPTSKKLILQNIQVSATCNGAKLYLKVKDSNGIEYSEFVVRIGTFSNLQQLTIDKIYPTDSIIWVKIVADTDVATEIPAGQNCAISVIINGLLY